MSHLKYTRLWSSKRRVKLMADTRRKAAVPLYPKNEKWSHHWYKKQPHTSFELDGQVPASTRDYWRISGVRGERECPRAGNLLLNCEATPSPPPGRPAPQKGTEETFQKSVIYTNIFETIFSLCFRSVIKLPMSGAQTRQPLIQLQKDHHGKIKTLSPSAKEENHLQDIVRITKFRQGHVQHT